MTHVLNNEVSTSYDLLTFPSVAPAATSISIGPDIVKHRLVSDRSGCVSPLDSATKDIYT